MLTCVQEANNGHDRNAVRLFQHGETVGHIPREISKPCSYSLLAGGSIYGIVIGKREKGGNGLEVPVEYHVKGPRHNILKAQAY